MKVIGLDPGTTQSAVVVYDAEAKRVVEAVTAANDVILAGCDGAALDALSVYSLDTFGDKAQLVIEKIEAMGMAVGAEVFETVFWSGRFYQAWPWQVERVSRRDVKLHLCGSMRAKDANVRQALIDKLGAPGTKKQKGPTYGVSSHQWAALAVAVTYADSWSRPSADTKGGK